MEITQCWFGDGEAVDEYWFEPRQEWRPLCRSHAANAVGNLPDHYVRPLRQASDD